MILYLLNLRLHPERGLSVYNNYTNVHNVHNAKVKLINHTSEPKNIKNDQEKRYIDGHKLIHLC